MMSLGWWSQSRFLNERQHPRRDGSKMECMLHSWGTYSRHDESMLRFWGTCSRKWRGDGKERKNRHSQRLKELAFISDTSSGGDTFFVSCHPSIHLLDELFPSKRAAWAAGGVTACAGGMGLLASVSAAFNARTQSISWWVKSMISLNSSHT